LRFGAVDVHGDVTSGSNLLTNLTTEELSRIRIGDPIKGLGIPTGTTVTAKADTQLTLSANATATTLITRNGTLTVKGTQMTVASVTGLAAGMTITGTGVPTGTTIKSIAGTTLTLSIASNSNYLTSPVTKTVQYKVVGGKPRLYMSDTSSIAAGNPVTGTGIPTGTEVVGISTNKFVELTNETSAVLNTNFTATFYTPATFTSQSYQFRVDDRYVIRPDGILPFGSFPGVGTIKT
jgi:hypothetical protein